MLELQSVTCYGFEQLGSYLSHESIGSSSFFIFEDNVRVVVGHQFLETRVVSRDFALGQTAGSQRVLTDVGHVLLEH